jgi:hypothetical protein
VIALLNPRVWIALAIAGALAACGVWVYRSGAASVQAKWDAERAQQLQVALDAERENRAIESKRAINVQEALDAYRSRAKVANAAAAAARSDADGVRDALVALAADGGASDTGAACRAERERIGVLSRLLAEGASLAAEGSERVGRLDGKVTGLQGFEASLRE